MAHFRNTRDIQMLAMLSCVFSESEQAEYLIGNKISPADAKEEEHVVHSSQVINARALSEPVKKRPLPSTFALGLAKQVSATAMVAKNQLKFVSASIYHKKISQIKTLNFVAIVGCPREIIATSWRRSSEIFTTTTDSCMRTSSIAGET